MENGQNCPTGSPEPPGTPNRIDWERNHQAIRKVIIDGLNGDGMPSYSELAAKTGLSLSTIKAHLSSLKTETAARFDRYKAATEEVLIGMYKAGKRGDARAGKLWLQFVEEWEERKKLTTVNANPYSARTDEDLRKALADRLAKAAGGPSADPA